MDKQRKTSTDPQENEINSNYLGKLYHMLTDDEKDKRERTERVQNKRDEDRTLDEEQDPANP